MDESGSGEIKGTESGRTGYEKQEVLTTYPTLPPPPPPRVNKENVSYTCLLVTKRTPSYIFNDPLRLSAKGLVSPN